MSLKKVIVIVGPTAVGKTKLSVELALSLNGEIISGDSMQIYKGMDIGTAKVTKEETKGIQHHLIDIKEFNESYSVKEFQHMVRSKIDEITSIGKIPIIVGGTGLYIKAVLYDYEFSDVKKVRVNDYEKMSNEQLHERLLEVDALTAQTIHPNNRRRVIRALEIYDESGIAKSQHIEKQEHRCLYDACFIGLTLPRDILYERIEHRVDLMMDGGLENEVKSLISKGACKENQSMKAIGYKEWFDYFDHLGTKENVADVIKQNSRRYAKRQYTWFKNQMDIHWLEVRLDNFDETIQSALDYVKHYQMYRYVAFEYDFQNLDTFKHDGILGYEIGYSGGDIENPTLYDLKTKRYHHLILIQVYYNESKISLEELTHLYNGENKTIYTKPSWSQIGVNINKIVKLKEKV